jgi:hypothetical protein
MKNPSPQISRIDTDFYLSKSVKIRAIRGKRFAQRFLQLTFKQHQLNVKLSLKNSVHSVSLWLTKLRL